MYTVLAGVNKSDGEVFLGTTDMWGLKLEDNFILTGMSLYFCQVLMENGWRADMSEQEAKQLLAKCAEVLFYKDKKAGDTVTFSVVTREGVRMEDAVKIPTPQFNLASNSTITNEFWRPTRCMYLD